MKRIILLFSIVICLMSCETKNVEITGTKTTINGQRICSYTIDSCEYLGSVIGGNGDFLTHKGNCKFCERRRLQEIDTIKTDF